MTTTKIFLEKLNHIYDHIEDSDLQEAQKAFIDFVGVGFAGGVKLKEDLVKSLLTFQGDTPTFNKKIFLNYESSVFYNAFSAHILELDDGHKAAMMHLGAPIFSALIGCLWLNGKGTYLDFLKSAIIGYECAIRIAKTIQPEHKLNGYHATGTCGTLGAAMACAFFLNYNNRQKLNVIGASSSSASGLLELIMGESEQKPYNAANASTNGFRAAIIGHSINGPSDPLCGSRGFINNFSKNPKWEELTKEDKAQISGIYYKLYAACRHCHAPIECALDIGKRINYKEIENIEVETYKLAVFGHEHTDIESINSAKMSIPFCVATAFIKGEVGMDAFKPENLEDQDILSLVKKVQVSENDTLSKLVPQKRGAILRVKLKNGYTETVYIENPSGEPENPVSDGLLGNKFTSLLVSSGKTESEAERILYLLKAFPMQRNAKELINQILS